MTSEVAWTKATANNPVEVFSRFATATTTSMQLMMVTTEPKTSASHFFSASVRTEEGSLKHIAVLASQPPTIRYL